MRGNRFVIETDRLGLRRFEASDARAFYELNKVPEVIRYTGDRPFSSPEEARDFLFAYDAYDKWGFGRWAVVLKETDQFIGFSGFKRHSEYIDLGYRIDKRYWGNGFATESAGACVEYGFGQLEFGEVVGRVAKQNIASIRVLEKLGFTPWKTGSCEGIPDALYYRITREVYKNSVLYEN